MKDNSPLNSLPVDAAFGPIPSGHGAHQSPRQLGVEAATLAIKV